MKMSDYLKLNKPELNMPRQDPFSQGDNLGIRYHGPVLEGLVGLNHQLERQASSNTQTSSQIREIAPGGLDYVNPNHNHPSTSIKDPRLVRHYRIHGFLSQFPHPSYADPVLRYHMGLPPIQHPAYSRPPAEPAPNPSPDAQKEGK